MLCHVYFITIHFCKLKTNGYIYDFILGHLSQRNKNLFQAETYFRAAYCNNFKMFVFIPLYI